MLIQTMPTSLTLKNYWRQLPDLSLSHILVWWFVCYAQIAAGLGLLAGGLATLPKIRDIAFLAVFGDLVTRFSGIVMCCVVTEIIWTFIKPESLITFIMTDYMHFSLWAGGLYFGLRGNWAVAIDKKP